MLILRHASSGSRPVCQRDTRELLQDRERPELCTAAQHVRRYFADWSILFCLHVSRLPDSATFGGVALVACFLRTRVLSSAHRGLAAHWLGVNLPFSVTRNRWRSASRPLPHS